MVVFGLVLLGNALAAPEEQVLTEKGATDSVEKKAEEVQNEERKCFVCYSCSRAETSQSILCQGEGENQCMKVHVITGQVDRRCSTELECQSEKNSTVNTNVLCCNTDNCNHGVKQWANSILLTMTATAAALATFIL